MYQILEMEPWAAAAYQIMAGLVIALAYGK
jgi:hypothetical protein